MIEEVFRLSGAGVSLAADRLCGEATSGRTVLLLHGGGQTRHSWRRTAVVLAGRGFEVISYDLRGHGDSDWDHLGRYSLADHGADLDAVLAAMPGQCAIVGASLGGLAGLEAAANRQRTVAGLALVDITPKVEAAGLHRIRDFVTADPDGFLSLEDAARAVQAYQLGRKRAVNPDGLRKNLRQDARGRWHWHWDPRVLDLDERALDEKRASSRRAASRLRIPLLLVRGALSDIVSDEGVAELRELVPQLGVSDVRGAGHMVAGDDNDVFTEVLVPFLEDVLSAGCASDLRMSQPVVTSVEAAYRNRETKWLSQQ